MSIAVPLEDLAAEVRLRGFGYLLTVDEHAAPRAVALVPEVIDTVIDTVIDAVIGSQERCVLRFRAGRGRTAANAAARPVSVVFPPRAGDEFSLVVDGTADVRDDTDGIMVDVTPTWAVRHRPAP